MTAFRWMAFLIQIGLCWLSLHTPALPLITPAQSLSFEHLSIDNGLSSVSVTSILQDQNGFIWVGTREGLNRFDGYHFKRFYNNPDDPNSLASNWVLALYEDDQGRVWVGSRAGLQYFDSSRNTFVKVPLNPGKLSEAAPTYVEGIIGIPGGQHPRQRRGLWISTNDGLRFLDTQTFAIAEYRYDPADFSNGASNFFRAITIDRDGHVWAGIVGGVARFRPESKRFDLFPLGSEDKRANTYAVFTDRRGILWIGTTAGLERWDLSAANPIRQPISYQGKSLGWILSIIEDKDGMLWIGSESDGLYKLDPHNLQIEAHRHRLNDKTSLGSDFIHAVFQDRSGSLWVGSWTAGLSRTDLFRGGFQRYFHLVGHSNERGDERIHAIGKDSQQRLWLGSSDGIVLFEPERGELTPYRDTSPEAASALSNQIQTIFESRDKQLWLGTRGGLSRFSPEKREFRRYVFNRGLFGVDWTYAITEDNDGTLWLATLSGLVHFNPSTETFESFRHRAGIPYSLRDDRVTSLLRDKRGVFWVGTLAGLDTFNPESRHFTHFKAAPGEPAELSSAAIVNLYEDKLGRLWIVTSAGLYRMDRDDQGKRRIVSYKREGGISGLPTGSLLEDNDILWLSTSIGVSRIDTKTEHVSNFTVRDGLLHDAYLWCSGAIGPDGTFYFGSLSGLTAFKPRQIRVNRIPPQIALTQLQIFNREVYASSLPKGARLDHALDRASKLELDHDNSVFSIEFSALHYSDPANNDYAFKLDGFDKEWFYVNAEHRLATYTNLDPGTYTLQIKASNASKVWNTSSKTLTIVIRPPFWKTWWFRLLTGIILIGIGIIIYRARLRSLIRQKERLERQVSARTAEVVLAHENISRLSEIGQELTATLDRASIIARLSEHVHQLIPLDGFTLAMLRRSLQRVEFPVAEEHGQPLQRPALELDRNEQIVVWCLARREPIALNCQFELAGNAAMTLFDGDTPASEVAIICVPMLVKDRAIGALCVRSHTLRSYHRVHLDLLCGLAAYGAIALDNADAYLKLQDTREQLIVQEKMAALGSMVAGVAHELNTPIGNCLLMSTVMLDEVEKISAKVEQKSVLRSELTTFLTKTKDSTALIHRGLDIAARLVESFKQVAVDRTTEQRREFDLYEVSAAIAATMMHRVHRAGHKLELDIPPGIAMHSYPGPYGQVIINFINNAMLHGFDEGQQGTLRLTAHRRGESVHIEFSDDGKGISESNLKRIFDPFFTTKFGQGGSGLGLSVSFNIVTSLLDGQISVDSQPGRGARFILDLPLVATEKQT